MEWLTLLRGAGLITNPKRNPLPETVPELSWNLLYALEVCGDTCWLWPISECYSSKLPLVDWARLAIC